MRVWRVIWFGVSALAVASWFASAAARTEPALTPIGIAEDTQSDGVARTAIVSGSNDLFLVKRGDTLAGRYRVDQVSSDAVRLTDTTTDESSTLVLR
jgi:hypothetical protein